MNPRLLQSNDFDHGYLQLLSQLTTVGTITQQQFQQQLSNIQQNPNHLIYVIQDNETNQIIASGTLLIELKFIHEISKVGHIEDIIVDKNYRGYGLGKIIINHLVQKAKEHNCYKVILDCTQDNVAFYEKCGFTSKEIEMVQYF